MISSDYDEYNKKLYESLKGALYDPYNLPPPDQTIFTIGDRPVGSIGNFIAFTGKPGMGKSIFLAGALASAVAPNVWGMRLALPEDRRFIQYYDTEQTAWQLHLRMQIAQEKMGLENFPRWIRGFLLREYEPDLMLDLIEFGIKINPKVSVVFIDGLLDLCKNFNSEEEAKKVSGWLRRITKQYNILVMAVIHTSKRDNFTLGHLGGEVDRWAESVLLVERDQSKKYIILCPMKQKGHFQEFKPVAIEFDGVTFNEVPDIDQAIKKRGEQHPPQYYPKTQHAAWMDKVIFAEGSTYDHVVASLAELTGQQKAKCKVLVKYWIEEKWIFKGRDTLYHQSKDAKLFIA
jgi:AAA domain